VLHEWLSSIIGPSVSVPSAGSSCPTLSISTTHVLVSDKRCVLGLLRRQWVLDHKFADVVGPCGVSPSHMYLSAVACIVIPSLQPSDPGRGVSSRNIGPFSLAIRLSADRDSAPFGFVSALRAAPLLPFTFVLSLIASFFALRRYCSRY
jgi:hypothetical protein